MVTENNKKSKFWREFPDLKYIPRLKEKEDPEWDLKFVLTVTGTSYLVLKPTTNAIMLILKPEELKKIKSSLWTIELDNNTKEVSIKPSERKEPLSFELCTGVEIQTEQGRLKVKAGKEKVEIEGKTDVAMLNGFLIITIQKS